MARRPQQFADGGSGTGGGPVRITSGGLCIRLIEFAGKFTPYGTATVPSDLRDALPGSG